MALGSLNCANYEIYVAERGGTALVCRLSASAIQYGRVINDFSEARVTTPINAQCRDCLSSVNPWQHELLVFRDGVQVWAGPLISIKYRPAADSIELYARDLLAWTEKRLIEIPSNDYDVEDVDIRQVFEWVLEHGYAKDPWGMTWSFGDTGIPITKFYPGYFPPDDRWGGQYFTCASELRSLSQAGIDYTVINRHVHGGDLTIDGTFDLIKVVDQNWAQAPEIVVDGTTMSTRTGVAGGSGGYYGWYDDQIWFEETEQPWGLLETLDSNVALDFEVTTELPNAITQEAYGRHKFYREPIAFVRGGQLAGDAPFDFNDLIPGTPVQILLINQLRDLASAYQRLARVDVTVSAEAENVSMVLTLPGVEDVKT